jgi:RNA polymerase sigma factor (sigma-70 family)
MSDDTSDRELVDRARSGDRTALRALVERHESFVFNVALKLFGDRDDAEDLTQEVFTRAITGLAGFRGDSAFTTWLYRIAANHFLATKRRGLELAVGDFAAFFDAVAAVPDEPEDAVAFSDATVEELRVRCTTGMLMCLDREQRLTFILGAMFAIPHGTAAEILGITPGNYRVRLHRARSDLGEWMQRRCGLVDRKNPCRCAKKTRGYVQLGLVDPRRLVFNADYAARIGDVARRDAATAMQTVEAIDDVFRSHPRQLARTDIVDTLLGNATLRRFFALDG